MKRLTLLVVFAAFVTYNACAQKVYIGCPEHLDTKPNAGFLDKQPVNLVISDSRVIPPGSKIECQGTDVEQALENLLRSDFPSCKITLLPDTLNSKASNPNGISIRLGITAYQATRSGAEWTGSVDYHVTIMDGRTGKVKKVSEDISNDTTRPYLFGFKAARTCLFTSFGKSNDDLVTFIINSLKE